MSDLLLQLISKSRNSRLCFGDYFLWKKTNLYLYVLGASHLNGASALTVSLLSTLWHNTHCGLTLPSPTLSKTQREIVLYMLYTFVMRTGPIYVRELTQKHNHRLFSVHATKKFYST